MQMGVNKHYTVATNVELIGKSRGWGTVCVCVGVCVFTAGIMKVVRVDTGHEQ